MSHQDKNLPHEHEPSGKLLPVVSEAVLQAVGVEFAQDEEKEKRVLTQMQQENPYLAEGVARMITAYGIRHPESVKGVTSVACMLYQCLRSQAEAESLHGMFPDLPIDPAR